MLQARRRRRRRTNTSSSSSSSILPNIVYNNMNHHQEDGDGDDCEPPLVVSCIFAIIYVISGATQPLLMYSVKDIGLSDPRCQLYMVAYYIGPACLGLTLCNNRSNTDEITASSFKKAASIACLDVLAQTINYTGAIMCGPTIFSIIYSSVTVWTAVQSRIILNRKLSLLQWIAVFVVFAGLLLLKNSATDNTPHVLKGAVLAIVGSILHALTYVLSEIIMTSGEKLSVRVNCFIQGMVACTVFLVWQLVYTSRHYEDLIQTPLAEAHTTYVTAAKVLFYIAFANLVHALTFFHTLRHFPGGATSAGLMKGLQAVLVFVSTALVFCGRRGGGEMCFSSNKFHSLIIVVSGVFLYGWATSKIQTNEGQNLPPAKRYSYQQIQDTNVELSAN